MSNYPSLRLVALLLASATAPIGSFAAAASPPYSSASLASQPLLDPDILSMLNQVDANRISADIQTLVSFGTRNTCSDNSGASRESAPRAIGFETGTSRFRGFRSRLFRGRSRTAEPRAPCTTLSRGFRAVGIQTVSSSSAATTIPELPMAWTGSALRLGPVIPAHRRRLSSKLRA